MKNSKYILGLFVLALVCATAATAAAPMVTFTYKDVTANKTAQETDTYGLNNAGAIAGDYVDSASVQHGMILAGKKLTTVDVKGCTTSPGSTATAFYGVNSAGAAVGWCDLTTSGEPTGFMYAKGKLTKINYPKALGTEANGINDKGDVVGTYFDTAGAQHGFLLHAKKYTSIDVPKDNTTVAWGINNKGQITVYALNTAGTYDAFILTGKKYKKVSDPNSASPGTVIHAINTAGDVDGTYYDSAGATHGFLLKGGKYSTLDDPEGADTRADGLNDKDVIVGRWGGGVFGGTGFEATPKK